MFVINHFCLETKWLIHNICNMWTKYWGWLLGKILITSVKNWKVKLILNKWSMNNVNWGSMIVHSLLAENRKWKIRCRFNVVLNMSCLNASKKKELSIHTLGSSPVLCITHLTHSLSQIGPQWPLLTWQFIPWIKCNELD